MGGVLTMRKSTKYALINSAIAGLLVFFGAFTDGQITIVGVLAAVSAAGVVFLTKFRDYVDKVASKKGAVSPGIFTFYGA
jgi:hypothetical protein